MAAKPPKRPEAFAKAVTAFRGRPPRLLGNSSKKLVLSPGMSEEGNEATRQRLPASAVPPSLTTEQLLPAELCLEVLKQVDGVRNLNRLLIALGQVGQELRPQMAARIGSLLLHELRQPVSAQQKTVSSTARRRSGLPRITIRASRQWNSFVDSRITSRLGTSWSANLPCLLPPMLGTAVSI